MATVDEHVRRQLRTLFAFGFFDRDAYVDDTIADRPERPPRRGRGDRGAGHRPARERGGRCYRSTPRKLGKVALIGPEADAIKDGGGSSAIDEFKITTPRRAFEARLGAERVVYDDGSDAASRGGRRQEARTWRWWWSATG